VGERGRDGRRVAGNLREEDLSNRRSVRSPLEKQGNGYLEAREPGDVRLRALLEAAGRDRHGRAGRRRWRGKREARERLDWQLRVRRGATLDELS
jgi:hypothetical protein